MKIGCKVQVLIPSSLNDNNPAKSYLGTVQEFDKEKNIYKIENEKDEVVNDVAPYCINPFIMGILPDIETYTFEHGDNLLITCDGVWDSHSNFTTKELMTRILSFKKGDTSKIINLCLNDYSRDNISALSVISFEQNEKYEVRDLKDLIKTVFIESFIETFKNLGSDDVKFSKEELTFDSKLKDYVGKKPLENNTFQGIKTYINTFISTEKIDLRNFFKTNSGNMTVKNFLKF